MAEKKPGKRCARAATPFTTAYAEGFARGVADGRRSPSKKKHPRRLRDWADDEAERLYALVSEDANDRVLRDAFAEALRDAAERARIETYQKFAKKMKQLERVQARRS